MDNNFFARLQHISRYVGEMRTKIGYYTGYVFESYADDVTADNFYKILRQDAEIARCSHLSSLQAAGEFYQVTCDNVLLKFLLEKMLAFIPDYTHARKSLIQKATLFGLGIQRKYYKTVKLRAFPGQIWQVVCRLKEVDRRRMRIERDIHNKADVYWTIWDANLDRYVKLQDRAIFPMVKLGTAIQDFCWYAFSDEEMAPYHEGFGAILYELAYIKKFCLTYWGQLAESWSRPFLTALIDMQKGVFNASGIGAGFASGDERARKYLDLLSASMARHTLVMDKSEELKIHEHGSVGNNIIQQLVNYCDDKIQLMYFGSELATNTGMLGSYALGAAQMVRSIDTITSYNQKRCAERQMEDILLDFCYRNRQNLYELGIKAIEPDDFRLTFFHGPSSTRAPGEMAELKGAGQLGEVDS